MPFEFFQFVSMFTHVVRWGYRQKHRAQVLFSLPMTDSEGHEIPAIAAFRQHLATRCGRQYGDNHECYGLLHVNDKRQPIGLIYVTFSDCTMIVHLSAPDQDGGEPHGNAVSLTLLCQFLENQKT